MAAITVTTIRPMTELDLADVMAIEQATFSTPWTEGIFRDELGQPSRTYLVAEESGRLVGYIGIMSVGEDTHITTVAVASDSAGRGIGTRLVLAGVEAGLAAGGHSLTLEVRSSNRRAQDLYRRFGMGPVGVRKHYYRDEDAIIMWAHDIDGPEYRARLDGIRRELG